MPSNPDRPDTPKPPQPAGIAAHSVDDPGRSTTREEVHAALLAEFDRLNGAHFDGRLILDELVVSTRKQYGGYCQPARRRIVVSWRAFQEHGWAETLLTFRHEVAHLVHPNHSGEFWALAEQLGCPPDRRHALPPKNRPAGWFRHVYACAACGSRYHRRRKLGQASCPRCDRRYNPDYALILVETHRTPQTLDNTSAK
jgi:hypothetical protein